MDFHWFSPRSNRVLVPAAALTLLASFYVESGLHVEQSPYYDEMLRAAELSARAAQQLKISRLERGVFVDTVNDPAETALIGQEYTQITTDRGYLDAKLASTDPNFAAVVIEMLHQLGVESGECVAVAVTGSFPALNLSVLAALETRGVRVALISSVGASNFGATDPFFTWLDMESELERQGLFTTRSVAASMGGGNDTGRGLSPKGRQLLRAAIERNGILRIEADQVDQSIRERARIYRESCAPEPVAAYVNVGGGVASLGHSLNGDLIPNGASERLPTRNYPARGALMRLAEDGAAVIHLLNIRRLRDRYGLEPVHDVVPPPGTGKVFGELRYHWTQTLIVTVLLIAGLLALYIFDRRAHALGSSAPNSQD
ncbi:MAG: poly-gamma-glutamate system protein [Acidobacteriota bacterium]